MSKVRVTITSETQDARDSVAKLVASALEIHGARVVTSAGRRIVYAAGAALAVQRLAREGSLTVEILAGSALEVASDGR